MSTATKSTRMESRNFFVSLVSLFLLVLETNNLNTGADPYAIVDAISDADVGRIVSIFFINFLNPIMKLINKTATWSWSFLKSANFWTQVVTVIITGTAMLGILYPNGAASNLVNAIFGGEFQAIAVALVVNVLNPLYHFIKDFVRKRKEGTTPATDISSPPLNK